MGGKNSEYEGGHRVPFIAVWPGVIPANSRCDSMINGTDLLATIAAVAGASFSDDQAKDSHNILPVLIGDMDYEPRSELVLQSGTGNNLILRQGPWKLIIDSTKGHNNLSKADTTAAHLFNLDDDPKESNDLINNAAYSSRVSLMYERYWAIRESTARTAPSSGMVEGFERLIDEDFSLLNINELIDTNQPIEDADYDSGLRVHNHIKGTVTTNASFGDGHVLQLTTGTNPTGGWGGVSAENNPIPVSLEIGDEVTLSFDMLVQALPDGGTQYIDLALRMTGATDIERAFTEYTEADIGTVVQVSWTTVVDADMANATDLSIWIPTEGHQDNYSSSGPNGNGTQVEVMQLDNIRLDIGSELRGYSKFEELHSLVGGKTDDDDKDSLMNVEEYVFGLDPLVADRPQTQLAEIQSINGDDYFTYTYQRNRSSVDHSAIRAWYTTDLSHGVWQLGHTVEHSVINHPVDSELEVVTLRSLHPVGTDGMEFMRLEILTSP